VQEKEVDFNPEFTARMIPRIDWPAFKQAAATVSFTVVRIIQLMRLTIIL